MKRRNLSPDITAFRSRLLPYTVPLVDDVAVESRPNRQENIPSSQGQDRDQGQIFEPIVSDSEDDLITVSLDVEVISDVNEDMAEAVDRNSDTDGGETTNDESTDENGVGGMTSRRERLPDAVLFSNDNLVRDTYHLKAVLHNEHPRKRFSKDELKMLQCDFNDQIKEVLDEAAAETGHPLGGFRFRALEAALRKHGYFQGGKYAFLGDMATFLSPYDYRKVKGLVIPDDDSNDTDPHNWDSMKKPQKNIYY